MKESVETKWSNAKGDGIKAKMLQAIGADYGFFLLPWKNLPKDIQELLEKENEKE